MENPLVSGSHFTANKLAALRRPVISGTFCLRTRSYYILVCCSFIITSFCGVTTANPIYWFLLGLRFVIGRGLLFLIVSAFAGAVTKFAQPTWLRSIQIASGLALLFVCYYYVKVFMDLQ